MAGPGRPPPGVLSRKDWRCALWPTPQARRERPRALGATAQPRPSQHLHGSPPKGVPSGPERSGMHPGASPAEARLAPSLGRRTGLQ